MRKLYILTSVHSAFDTRIFHKQAKSFVQKGYQVNLVVPHNRNEVVDDINIIGIKKPKNRFIRFLVTIFTILKVALISDADIFHIHDPELLLICPVLSIFKQKPIIYDVHEHYPNSILSKDWIPKVLRKIVANIFKIIERILIVFVDGIIYTTPIVGERYENKNIKTKRVDNYPKMNLLKTNIDNLEKNYNNIIYVGGITKIRGIFQIVEAIKIVVDNNYDVKLKLIGKFSPGLRQKVKDLIIKYNLKDNIIIAGTIPYEKVGKELKKSTIGIVTYLPYPNNLSCLPNKMFEYMATQNVVIASDFPLYKEVINGSKAGLLVDPEDPKDIAEKIIYLFNNHNKINEYSNNGYQAVKNKYNWNIEKEKLYELYNDILNSFSD